MANATKLQRAAAHEATLQDLLVAQFGRELQIVLLFLGRKIRGLVQQFDTQGGRLVTTQQALGRAIRLRRDILKAFEAAGVSDLMTAAVDAPLDRLTDQVLKASPTAQRLADLSAFDLEALAAFKALRLAALFDLTNAAATTLWRVTLDGVMGARPFEDLIADLEDALDGTRVQAERLYDTSVSTYARQVGLLHTSGLPGELFLFAGPVDGKTRRFCLEHVGTVLSRAEIGDLDNGQLPDVLVTGGGYNCRHRWMRVSVLDQALVDLHDSGDRLPTVEAQVEAVA